MSTTHFDISGRLAFVTGSARGLGNVYARALAGAGCAVVIHGPDTEHDVIGEQAVQIAREFGVKTYATAFDVTDAELVVETCEEMMNQVGVPDILVNNAGIQRRGPFIDLKRADWDDVVSTDLSSVFYVSQPIVHRMAERGSGRVINIGSVLSKLARPTVAPYGAAKGGIVMLTQVMATELARYNIQVNAISPGYFRTDLNEALTADPDFSAWVENRTPAGRWGAVEELEGILLFLCSPAASFITGQNIFVDGGLSTSI